MILLPLNIMNKLILGLLIYSISLAGFSQSKSEIGKYLESANTEQIIRSCDLTIDLELPKSKGVYDKDQAKVLLKKFFKVNQPKKYFVKHKGGNKEKKFFEIGSLLTETNDYRTYFLYDLIDDHPQIIELRIEISD